MSVRSTFKTLRVPGALSINPSDSDLSGSFPYGGTARGYSTGVTRRVETALFTVRAEEFAGAPVEQLERGEYWIAAGAFNAYDKDAVAALFPNTRTGAKTNLPIVQSQHAGTRRGGMRISDRTVKLVFTPDDVDRAPGWIMYRAAPSPDLQQRLVYDWDLEHSIPFVFVGLPDTTSELNVGETGPLVDLQVTPT